MFTRRQPREVYRVYGEEEFFTDDLPQFGEEPQSMTATAVRGPSEELRSHESAQLPPDIFEEYDTVARGTPLAQDEDRLSEPWASAELPSSESDDPHEPAPRYSPRVATHPGARGRRTLAIALLAAGLGLLVGLIAVSSLRSGHPQGNHQSPSSQTPNPAVATTPPRPRAQRRHIDAASRRRQSSQPIARVSPSAPAHSATAPRIHRDVAVAEAPSSSQAAQSPLEIPAGAPPPTYLTPTYAPPPPSSGVEFGFER